MKYFSVFLCLQIMAISVIAQTSSSYKYSINVNGFSLLQLPSTMNSSNSNKFYNSYLNGGTFKIHKNQINARLGFRVFNQTVNIENESNNNLQTNSMKVSDYAFKVGFEKNINYSTIQPYYFIDIGYRHNKSSSADQGINQMSFIKNGGLISPGLGLKINVLEYLSFFAEGNVDLMYYYEKQKNFAADGSLTENNRNKFEFLTNPVTAGIIFNIGSAF